MSDKKDPSLSPRYTNGPVVKDGPNAGQNRARNKDGAWRKKRDDAGQTREKKKSGCFITTAACAFQGLTDNCYELTVLREFRDNYLLKTEAGKALIAHYYEVSPEIASRINISNISEVWEGIRKTVAALENREFVAATEFYRAMVNGLQEGPSVNHDAIFYKKVNVRLSYFFTPLQAL